jgi:hypothetical protein
VSTVINDFDDKKKPRVCFFFFFFVPRKKKKRAWLSAQLWRAEIRELDQSSTLW